MEGASCLSVGFCPDIECMSSLSIELGLHCLSYLNLLGCHQLDESDIIPQKLDFIPHQCRRLFSIHLVKEETFDAGSLCVDVKIKLTKAGGFVVFIKLPGPLRLIASSALMRTIRLSLRKSVEALDTAAIEREVQQSLAPKACISCPAIWIHGWPSERSPYRFLQMV